MTIKVYFEKHEIPVNTMVFSGGEVQVKLEPDPRRWELDPTGPIVGKARIRADLRSSKDVMELLMVTDAVRQMVPGHLIDLLMPYVPYARQDRVCNEGEALSIKVFCNLINSQGYDSVTIWDPHSDVTPALLNKVRIVEPITFLARQPTLVWDKHTLLVSPDAGAIKKVSKLAAQLGVSKSLETIRADKTRDVSTGALSGTVVYGNVTDREVMIIDDICDGGYTFILLGKKLKEMGAAKVSLYVTHGIFSKGLDVFEGAVDEIYCPNIWTENVIGRDKNGILYGI